VNSKILLISILLIFSQILFSQTINYNPPEGIEYFDNSSTNDIYNYQDSLGFINIQIKIITNKNFQNFKKNFDTNHFFEKNNIIPLLIENNYQIDSKSGILLKGYVLINGQSAPIVGNVCMDLCMVDVTDIDAKEGDEVILFGNDLSVIDLAESIGTIPYEVLTSVSPRVKRVYITE